MKVIQFGCLAFGLCAMAAEAQDRLDLTDPKQKESYALGANFAAGMRQHELDLDPVSLASGLKDALAGQQKLTDQEVRETLGLLQTQIVTQGQRRNEAIAAENLKKTNEFLAENAKKAGITSTGSGLQYEVLKSGSGPTPTATNTVTIEFKGSLSTGEPINVPAEKNPKPRRINGYISGVGEALRLMRIGDKWRLFIPPHLAYGEESYPPRIPPNSVLVFELELLGIEEAKQPGK